MPIVTVSGFEDGQEAVEACSLMTQVTVLSSRVQLMLPLGASKAGSSWALAGAGALSAGVAEALGVADAEGEADWEAGEEPS